MTTNFPPNLEGKRLQLWFDNYLDKSHISAIIDHSVNYPIAYAKAPPNSGKTTSFLYHSPELMEERNGLLIFLCADRQSSQQINHDLNNSTHLLSKKRDKIHSCLKKEDKLTNDQLGKVRVMTMTYDLFQALSWEVLKQKDALQRESKKEVEVILVKDECHLVGSESYRKPLLKIETQKGKIEPSAIINLSATPLNFEGAFEIELRPKQSPPPISVKLTQVSKEEPIFHGASRVIEAIKNGAEGVHYRIQSITDIRAINKIVQKETGLPAKHFLTITGDIDKRKQWEKAQLLKNAPLPKPLIIGSTSTLDQGISLTGEYEKTVSFFIPKFATDNEFSLSPLRAYQLPKRFRNSKSLEVEIIVPSRFFGTGGESLQSLYNKKLREAEAQVIEAKELQKRVSSEGAEEVGAQKAKGSSVKTTLKEFSKTRTSRLLVDTVEGEAVVNIGQVKVEAYRSFCKQLSPSSYLKEVSKLGKELKAVQSQTSFIEVDGIEEALQEVYEEDFKAYNQALKEVEEKGLENLLKVAVFYAQDPKFKAQAKEAFPSIQDYSPANEEDVQQDEYVKAKQRSIALRNIVELISEGVEESKAIRKLRELSLEVAKPSECQTLINNLVTKIYYSRLFTIAKKTPEVFEEALLINAKGAKEQEFARGALAFEVVANHLISEVEEVAFSIEEKRLERVNELTKEIEEAPTAEKRRGAKRKLQRFNKKNTPLTNQSSFYGNKSTIIKEVKRKIKTALENGEVEEHSMNDLESLEAVANKEFDLLFTLDKGGGKKTQAKEGKRKRARLLQICPLSLSQIYTRDFYSSEEEAVTLEVKAIKQFEEAVNSIKREVELSKMEMEEAEKQRLSLEEIEKRVSDNFPDPKEEPLPLTDWEAEETTLPF